MSNEKAIRILKELWRFEKTDKFSEEEIRQALSIAIKAIEAVDYDCANCLWYQRAREGVKPFTEYQIEWLTSHNDIEFQKPDEDLIIQFLKDTAEDYMRVECDRDCEHCDFTECPKEGD